MAQMGFYITRRQKIEIFLAKIKKLLTTKIDFKIKKNENKN
jgi:hypothetical protein